MRIVLKAQIPALAAALTTLESPVLVVDQLTGFDAVVDTYDGVHPDESSELKMAGKWLQGLELVIESVAVIFSDGFESGDVSAWNPPTPRASRNLPMIGRECRWRGPGALAGNTPS